MPVEAPPLLLAVAGVGVALIFAVVAGRFSARMFFDASEDDHGDDV